MRSHHEDASPRSWELKEDPAADVALARMGYEAELQRNMSMFSVMGLSVAIMAVPISVSVTMLYSLTNGQCVTVIWGWIFVSLISLCIAASLAEICAVFPTAGGVYYWSAMLSTRKWAPIASWITGWLTLVGNWTVTASINFSGGQVILSAITLWDETFVPNAWQTVLMFWFVMLVCMAANIFLVRWLDLLNKICIYWTVATVVVTAAVLLSMADHRHRGAYVFGHYDASASGWPAGWSFFVGLLQGAYTLTGYGMVASMCEEVKHPERQVPIAMVLSVAMAGLVGVFFLVPILFVLPDVATLLAVPSGQPIGLLFMTATGSASAAFGLLFLLFGILFFAGTGALTAASRCTYAFSRDGAVPGSRIWKQVHYDLPIFALLLSTLIDCLLGLIYFGSAAAFNSFTGVTTICLSTSYAMPILVSVLRRREAVKHSPFPLGKFGYAINMVMLCWICLAVVLFSVPTAIPVTPESMNYASVVFAFFASISLAWYFIRGRKSFTGPPVPVDMVVREATFERKVEGLDPPKHRRAEEIEELGEKRQCKE